MPKAAKQEEKAEEKPEEKVSETTTVAPPAVVEEPELTEQEKFFNDDLAHRLYSTGLACKECGAPVDKTWKECAFCGESTAISIEDSRLPTFDYSDVKKKHSDRYAKEHK